MAAGQAAYAASPSDATEVRPPLMEDDSEEVDEDALMVDDDELLMD